MQVFFLMALSLISLMFGLIFEKDSDIQFIQSHPGEKGAVWIIDAQLYKELENNLHESVMCSVLVSEFRVLISASR